ncbi:MAG: DNA-processing protein DprA [Treponema sp.]|nr:DNA-processing protein DprA [Treponema sp.]MCL2272120.1 DNA-processing protein DprA [Treponema sp.]
MNNRGLLDLIISLLPGLSAAEKIKMSDNFNNEDELLICTQRQTEALLERALKKYWEINDIRDRADKIDTICRKRSINWVSWTDASYPPLLREIYDPPPVIYYIGHLPNPEKSLLGMVGTRKPSPQAASHAYKLSFGAGRSGVSVISGLAIGIDTMSHRGNLIGCAPGYAVLGSGIDQIYPSSNRLLAKRILDSGGAVISEYSPGVLPGKWTFPARNRIISAMSRSVLIVEAPEKSGALITASFALEQGRDLWVASSGIQQSVYYDRSGTIKLADDGAEIINLAQDIFEKWNITAGEKKENTAGFTDEPASRRIAASTANILEIEI